MQQTVLLTAIRGPDGIQKYSAAKYLLRWFRRCVLISAFDNCILQTPHDPRGGSFTGPSYTLVGRPPVNQHTSMADVIDGYFREHDTYPAHFTKHFMMAAEIVGYKHPDPSIRDWWRKLYLRLVKDMHLNPETEEQLDYRLGDNREQWLNGAEEATNK